MRNFAWHSLVFFAYGNGLIDLSYTVRAVA